MTERKKDRISIGKLSVATGYSITHLRRLAEDGAIPSELTQGGQRRFELASVTDVLQERENRKKKNQNIKRNFRKIFKLTDLKEDLVWAEAVNNLGLSKSSPAWDVAPYAFTAM